AGLGHGLRQRASEREVARRTSSRPDQVGSSRLAASRRFNQESASSTIAATPSVAGRHGAAAASGAAAARGDADHALGGVAPGRAGDGQAYAVVARGGVDVLGSALVREAAVAELPCP